MAIQSAGRTPLRFRVAIAIALLPCPVMPVFAQTVTSDVLRASVFVQGVIQFETFSNQMIHPVQIVSADLVNLALGRELSTALQSNEVLAFGSSPSTNNAKVFVYDSSTASNLATIGRINPLLQAAQSGTSHRETEVIAQLDVPGAGTISNGLTGGNLMLDGRSVLDTNGSVMKFNAKLVGILDTVFVATITNFSVTNSISFKSNKIITNSVVVTNVFIGVTNIPVVIRTATVNTGSKKIGTLIEGP